MSMKVVKVIPNGRHPNGQYTSGRVIFSDGKDWRFGSYDNHTRVSFGVDSGVPSQWSKTNNAQWIAPKKRVAAFVEFMKQHCHFCVKETDENEHACIHCGKSKSWVGEQS